MRKRGVLYASSEICYYFEFVKIVSCWYLSLICVPLFQQDKMNDPHHKHL